MAPATEHRFREEPLPQAVVLDADFVVNVLHEGEEYHRDCLRFAVRLLRNNVSVVYTQLLRLEFLSGWQNAMRRRGVPSELLQQKRLLENPAEDRRAMYELGDEFFSDFLTLFNRYEVRLSAKLQRRARSYMAKYNLKPMDACLIASAFQTEVLHVASLDKDFRRVDGVHLWNDHIPTRRLARRQR